MPTTKMKQLFSMLFLALAAGGSAWFCSRSADGRPAEFLMMWAVIGLIHCIVDCKFQKRFFNLQMFGLYFVFLLIGFSQSELDEMGGMLYYIAGAEVVAVCIISEIIKWIYRLKKRS
ncbi:MAG: hypothetical protein E7056_06625 [Lentisphaerae bacterium]|nr:hypothetical protein [Lentisphaerota bacterium]